MLLHPLLFPDEFCTSVTFYDLRAINHLKTLSVSGLDRIQVQKLGAERPRFGELDHSHRQNGLNTKHSTEG